MSIEQMHTTLLNEKVIFTNYLSDKQILAVYQRWLERKRVR